VDRHQLGFLLLPLIPLWLWKMGDAREGEDPKSPSFAEILKKNPHPSPPLTRGRKTNINRKVKEAESGNSGGSERTLGNISNIEMG
jgi:hypothetical protein